MPKDTLPNIIFVSPTGRGKDKIRHKHTVFQITEFVEDGWPKTLRLVRDDEIVDLRDAEDGAMCFMTAYCQMRSLGPWKGKSKGQ